MDIVKATKEGGTLRLLLSGRVDSVTAPAAETAINELIAAETFDDLVVDADDLEYISSAGLRVILRLKKQYAGLKIVNASSEVYDIFEMTGFTEIIPIEKAYRKLSVEGCEVIGQGANGKVYRLDSDTIIKVYFNPDSLPDIHRERELARKAFVLGIPTAIPYDVVKVDKSYGSVFELLNAKSFAALIKAEPENIDKYIALYADLLKKIHGTAVPHGDMPNMKQVAQNWAAFLAEYLPNEKYRKLCDLIAAVPESDQMMHGDYHIKNVMMQNGEVLLIDMDTLCVGNPVFEFASVYLAYLGYSENDHQIIRDFLGIEHETAKYIWEQTLRLYLGTDDEAVLRAAEDKAMVIGYTRMMRRTIRREKGTPAGDALIETCRRHLYELLDRVDSLAF